ncbi:MAG: hypothetical protein ACM3ZT_04215 [Bacillota bacterium]
MKSAGLHVSLLAAGLLSLTACTGVEEILGMDPGRVRLGCSSGGPLVGSPPLQASYGSLVPGTKLEILMPPPDRSVLFTLPEGNTGDVFAYDWKENAVGSGRPPGIWQCRVSWRYDGEYWRLLRLDAQWIGGAPR